MDDFKIAIIEQQKETGKRYLIVDRDTGEIIDDAQGYGYKTRQKAYAAYYYKYKGGKEKLIEYEKFWKERKHIAKFINNYCNNWIKEIALNEITDDDIASIVKEELGEEIPKKMIKYSDLAFKKAKK